MGAVTKVQPFRIQFDRLEQVGQRKTGVRAVRENLRGVEELRFDRVLLEGTNLPRHEQGLGYAVGIKVVHQALNITPTPKDMLVEIKNWTVIIFHRVRGGRNAASTKLAQ